MAEYRVLLIEQNRMMLERLSSVIRSTRDFQLVSRAADIREALGQCSLFVPNLILLDIDTLENTDFIGEFARLCPQAAILALGSQWNSQAAAAAAKAGARGYLIKPFTGEELAASVHAFGSGGLSAASKVITFFSPKGKSGKTTLIANLAMSLARHSGENVAIIDADLQFGDMSVFFNLEPQTTIVEAARDIDFLSPVSLRSYFTSVTDSVHVLCSARRPEFAEQVSPAALADVLVMARSLFRFILVDVPSAFNPVSISAAEASDSVYLVSMVSGGYETRHMRRALDIFRAWPDCASRVRTVFTRVEPCEQKEQQRLEELLGYPVAAILPNEYLLVAAAANNGRMAVDIKPGAPLAQSINLLAAQLCRREEE